MTQPPPVESPEHGPGPIPYHEAAALVGVEIDPGKLSRTERVRTCDHLEFGDAPDAPRLETARTGEWEFCPWCGKPLYEERVVSIPEWDSTDPARLLLAGFTVVTTAAPDAPGLALTEVGRDVIRLGVRIFAGEIVARTDAGRMARLAPVSAEMLADARARLQTRLAPLGLWDDRTFGVWAVLNRVR